MIIIIIWSDEDFEKIKKRDPSALDKVYTEYKNKVFTFLIIKTNGDKELAEEILCETFHSAVISCSSLKNKNSIVAWLLSIASRRLNDFFRKKYREKKYSNKIAVENKVDDDMAENLQRKQEILMVNTAMKNLKENYRNILKLKYIEKKTQREIAEYLKLSDSSVNSLLQRARKALRREFKKVMKDY